LYDGDDDDDDDDDYENEYEYEGAEENEYDEYYLPLQTPPAPITL